MDPEAGTVVVLVSAELVSVTELDELEFMSSDVVSRTPACVLKYH